MQTCPSPRVCVLLAASPMDKCIIAKPPLDACIQQGEKIQSTFSWQHLFLLYSVPGKLPPLFLDFPSLFFPLSLTVSWVDVFAIMKSIET